MPVVPERLRRLADGKPQAVGEGRMMAQAHDQMQQKQQRQDALYTCNCGAGCDCNTVKTSPGKCRCGMDLKKVD